MSDLPDGTKHVPLLYDSITVNLDPDEEPEGVEVEEQPQRWRSVLATFDRGL